MVSAALLVVTVLQCNGGRPFDPGELAGRREPAWIESGSADIDDDFPATVLIRPHTELCSGVAISDSAVLTAAHCLDGLLFGQQLGVYPGPVVAEQQLAQTVDYHIHPDFCHECFRDPFDIALIELREPLGLESYPRIPETRTEFEALVYEGASVTAVGYGKTRDGTAADVRQVLEQVVSGITASGHQFAASGGGGICKGDSGGPVFVDVGGERQLVGIVARGSSSECDGETALRAGTTTAALCWLSEIGYYDSADDEAFCEPDPSRMGGCANCSAGSPDTWGMPLLLSLALLAASRGRRTGVCA